MVDVLEWAPPEHTDGIPHSQWCLCPGFPLAGSRRQDPGGGELIPHLVLLVPETARTRGVGVTQKHILALQVQIRPVME